MTIDLGAKSVEELKNIIANHRTRGVMNTPGFLAAVRELELRQGKGFDLEKTIGLVTTAARERRFVGYKSVAEASEVATNQLHYGIGRHLGALCLYAHGKGMPLLSSIIVNTEYVKTGEMKPDTRDGFIKIARELSFLVTDEQAFLRQEQERVFNYFADEVSA